MINNHAYKPERAKRYESTFNEHLLPLAKLVQETLEYLTDPTHNRHTNKPVSSAHEEVIPWTMGYSAYVVFSSLLDMARNSQHISTAILTRSLLECMANINWLHQDHKNITALREKTQLMFDQAEKVYELTSGKVDRIPTIKDMGGGTITDRLKACGEGWLMVYAHMSSYCHMDAGFAIHYGLNETLGVRNLCVYMSCWSAESIIEQLLDLPPDRLDRDQTAVLDKLDLIRKKMQAYRESLSKR